MEISTGNELVNSPQSTAGIKLSGCKNCTAATRTGDHSVFLPAWGITVNTQAPVPENVKCLGIRAFFLERAQANDPNAYHVRVVRTSDSRFDRSVLLEFLERGAGADAEVSQTENEMAYLEQHLFWRVDKLKVPENELPVKDEELYIRMPEGKTYLVSK